VLSITPKILEISVGIQMERSVSVSSDRNIRDILWRWPTYFGWNIPIEIRRSIFDKPVLFPNDLTGRFGIMESSLRLRKHANMQNLPLLRRKTTVNESVLTLPGYG